ncbi:hypothetical protein ACJX0J_026536, partial [Zea mays]
RLISIPIFIIFYLKIIPLDKPCSWGEAIGTASLLAETTLIIYYLTFRKHYNMNTIALTKSFVEQYRAAKMGAGIEYRKHKFTQGMLTQYIITCVFSKNGHLKKLRIILNKKQNILFCTKRYTTINVDTIFHPALSVVDRLCTLASSTGATAKPVTRAHVQSDQHQDIFLPYPLGIMFIHLIALLVNILLYTGDILFYKIDDLHFTDVYGHTILFVRKEGGASTPRGASERSAGQWHMHVAENESNPWLKKG